MTDEELLQQLKEERAALLATEADPDMAELQALKEERAKLINESPQEETDLMGAFTRGAKRLGKKALTGALYLPDVAASIIREPANMAISALGGPKRYLKPVGETLDKYIDEKTEGSLKPRNKLEEYEDDIAEALGSTLSGAGLGKIASMGASAISKGAGAFLSAGTAPTTSNLVATAAVPSAIKAASDNDLIAPIAIGAGAVMGGKKLYSKGPDIANWIGKKIDFNQDTYKKLNEIPDWDKVGTLADYVESPSVKKLENLTRKLPGLGSEIEERALQKGQKVKEAMGQEGIDENLAPHLAKKGADSAEAKYHKVVGEALVDATSHIKDEGFVPINATKDYLNVLEANAKSEGGKKLLDNSKLGEYASIVEGLQTPRKMSSSKEYEKLINDPTFQGLGKESQNQILKDMGIPRPSTQGSHAGQAYFHELLELRSKMISEIDWGKGRDLKEKEFYRSLNKDLGNYFASFGEGAKKSWDKFNSETVKYIRTESKDVNKIQKFFDSDDKIKAFLHTLPTKAGAKEAKIVMNNLGEDAPEFLNQIIHHMGSSNGTWNPMEFARKWKALRAPVQHELLEGSGLPQEGQKYVKRMIEAIDPISSTLTQNLNTSDSATFLNIIKVFSMAGAIPIAIASGHPGVAATNLLALGAVKGASRYIFSNHKFARWINEGMNQKTAKGLENWSKGIKHFPDAPKEFKTNLALLINNIAGRSKED